MATIKQLFRAVRGFLCSKTSKQEKHIDGVYSSIKLQLQDRIDICKFNMSMTEEYFHKFGAHYLRIFSQNPTTGKQKEFCVIVIDTNAITYQSIYTIFNYPVTMSRSANGINTFMSVYFERDVAKLEKELN